MIVARNSNYKKKKKNMQGFFISFWEEATGSWKQESYCCKGWNRLFQHLKFLFWVALHLNCQIADDQLALPPKSLEIILSSPVKLLNLAMLLVRWCALSHLPYTPTLRGNYLQQYSLTLGCYVSGQNNNQIAVVR